MTNSINSGNDHRSVTVAKLPNCDVCASAGIRDQVAKYDGKTIMGPWANMCQACFADLGVGLGLGRGQELIMRQADEQPHDRRRDLWAAIEAGNLDLAEEIIGDGDLAGWL